VGLGSYTPAAGHHHHHTTTDKDERDKSRQPRSINNSTQKTHRPGRYSAILDHLLQKEWW
jgi:hypothetical protein